MYDGEGELIVGRGKITSLGVTLFHVVDNRDERPDCHILLMWCEMLVHLSWSVMTSSRYICNIETIGQEHTELFLDITEVVCSTIYSSIRPCLLKSTITPYHRPSC